MKITQLFLIFTICLLITSCKTENNRTSKEVRKVFNQQEIRDLNILVDYFESKIRVEGKSIESCYKDWIQAILEGGDGGLYDINIVYP